MCRMFISDSKYMSYNINELDNASIIEALREAAELESKKSAIHTTLHDKELDQKLSELADGFSRSVQKLQKLNEQSKEIQQAFRESQQRFETLLTSQLGIIQSIDTLQEVFGLFDKSSSDSEDQTDLAPTSRTPR